MYRKMRLPRSRPACAPPRPPLQESCTRLRSTPWQSGLLPSAQDCSSAVSSGRVRQRSCFPSRHGLSRTVHQFVDVSLRIVQDVLVGDSHGLLESRNNGLGLFKGNGRLIALSVWLRLGLSSRVTSETRLKASKKEKEGDENEPAWDNCESGHGDGRRLLNLNGPRHGKSRSPLEVERGSSCASIRTPFGRWASYDIQHE